MTRLSSWCAPKEVLFIVAGRKHHWEWVRLGRSQMFTEACFLLLCPDEGQVLAN